MAANFADVRKVIQIAVPLAAALFVAATGRISAQAQTNHMLVIPASDGYGFDDCLSGGKTCGKTIADAWCEAHGMSASQTFGRADDITASVPAATTTDVAALKLQPGSYVVTCKE